MKRKAINIIKVVSFVSVFFVGLILLYGVFKWKDTHGNYLSSFDALYSLDDNKVDVLFLGPSFTYCSVNPAKMWEEYGISVFNMSVSGQDKGSTISCIKEVSKTQSPKIVLVDVSGTLFDTHAILANIYRNTITMRLGKNNLEHINSMVDREDRLDYYLRWPIVHTRYKELERYDFEQNYEEIYSMGFFYCLNVTERGWINDPYYIEDVKEISDVNKKWIDNLEALSKENQFELIFYLTPGAVLTERRDEINGITQYLNSKNIKFIDFDKTDIVGDLDYSRDFLDYSHLSYFGAEKVSSYFGRYLTDNYDLKDHRDEPGYEAWHNSENFYNHKKTDISVQSAADPITIAQLVSGVDNMDIVISLEGNFRDANCNVNDTFEALAGEYVEIPKEGGTWIFEDGKLSSVLGSDEEYMTKLNKAEFLEVRREADTDSYYYTNVTLGNKEFRSEDYHIDGMYMFVYDKLTKQEICRVCFE